MRPFWLGILLFLSIPVATALSTTYNTSFTNDTGGWTGSCAQNSTAGTLFLTTNFATCNSPLLNLSSTTWFNFRYQGLHTTNGTTFKGYALEGTTTTDNDHLIMDTMNGYQRWRNEPGFDQVCNNTIPYNTWNNYTWIYNKTNTTSANVTFNVSFTGGSCQWSKILGINWTDGRDYIRLAPGDLNSGSWSADNMTLTVLDNETPANYSPVMASISITPANIQDNQDATGHVTANDPNNDTISYYCSWTVNGNLVASPILTNRTAGVEQFTAVLSETNYGANDLLNFSCTATDGLHNTTIASSTVTVQSTSTGSSQDPPVVGGGGAPGSTTITVIQQVNATAPIVFGTDLISKFTVLNDYNEQPRLIRTTLSLNKRVKDCQVTGNLSCTISKNQTALEVAHRVDNYDFLTQSVQGSITAVSTDDETTSTRIEFKLFNLAAGIGPTTSLTPPSFFHDVPYLLRVDRDGHFAGIRLLPLLITLAIVGFVAYQSITGGR